MSARDETLAQDWEADAVEAWMRMGPKRFREGMAVLGESNAGDFRARILEIRDDGSMRLAFDGSGCQWLSAWWCGGNIEQPDFGDDGTKGVLLGMAQVARGEPYGVVESSDGPDKQDAPAIVWHFTLPGACGVAPYGETYALACLRAIDADGGER